MTRTLIQSEMTRVPAVTAERSPPAFADHRRADSPVIAASLTKATPSITSPSAGNEVAGLDQHDIAGAQRAAATTSVAPTLDAAWR